MRRTSRTLLGWCKNTRSCWMRTRVCPCTTRTAKNSWNSSEFSNRRDRAHPDQADTRPNCPNPRSGTLTLPFPIFSIRTDLHTHISLAFCCPACSLIDMCPPGPCWHSDLFLQTKQQAQRPLVSTSVSALQDSFGDEAAGWELCVFLNGRRKISGLLGCLLPLCVSEWLYVCVRVYEWVNPCYANQPPPFQISVFICGRVHEPLLTHSCFQSCWMPVEGSADILGFSVVSSVFTLGFFSLSSLQWFTFYDSCWLIFAFGHIWSDVCS